MNLKFAYSHDLECAIRAPLLAYGLPQEQVNMITADIFNSVTNNVHFDLSVAEKAVSVVEKIADIDSISSRCRKIKYTFARYIICRFLSNKGASLGEIGKCIGRDHSNVKYLLIHYDGLYKTSFIFREWQKLFDIRMNKPE